MSAGGLKTKLLRGLDRADRWLGPRISRKPLRLVYWLSGSSVRFLMRLLFGLRILGIEHVPREGRILLVSNHLSNFDPPLIGSSLPREIYFAAKIELFDGFLGLWVKYHNSLPIRRAGSDKDAIKRLVGVLKEDNALLMFPQGTRQKEGHSSDTKAGPGMVASLANADVLPIRISGSEAPKRALFKRGGMTVRFGNVIPHDVLVAQASALAGPEAGKKELYHAMADVMMNHVRALGD